MREVAVGGTDLILSTPLPLPNPLQLNYGMETAWSASGGGCQHLRVSGVVAEPGLRYVVVYQSLHPRHRLGFLEHSRV